MSIPRLLLRSVQLYGSSPVRFLSIALILLPLAASLALVEGWWSYPAFAGVTLASRFPEAALAYAAAGAADGRAATIRQSYAAVLVRSRQLLIAAVRYFAAAHLLALTVVGIPFAILLFVRWFFFVQAVVLRGLGASEALDFSSQLVKGRWWQILGAVLLVTLLAGVVTIVPVVAFWSLDRPALLLSSVVGVVVAPAVTCFYTLLFLALSEDVAAGTAASHAS